MERRKGAGGDERGLTQILAGGGRIYSYVTACMLWAEPSSNAILGSTKSRADRNSLMQAFQLTAWSRSFDSCLTWPFDNKRACKNSELSYCCINCDALSLSAWPIKTNLAPNLAVYSSLCTLHLTVYWAPFYGVFAVVWKTIFPVKVFF